MEPLSFCVDYRAQTSRSAVHDELARVFSFPAHYGRNLDALYDCLTALPPCRICLQHTSFLYPALGPYAEKLLSTFRDAAQDSSAVILDETEL